MAALFPRFSAPNGLDTLLRLLDTSEAAPRHSHHSQVRSFTPRFDVREGEFGYELHGELPGIKQEDVDIEFVDSNTLVIKGRSEREYVTKSTEEDGKPDEAVHPKPHKATVEDENANTTSTAITSTAISSAESGTIESRREEPSFRYWVSERAGGEFHRTFTFPGKVDRDAVKANLKNGILTVIVPKQLKREAESRKITIGA